MGESERYVEPTDAVAQTWLHLDFLRREMRKGTMMLPEFTIVSTHSEFCSQNGGIKKEEFAMTKGVPPAI
jgi:hypothetical protein